MHVEYKVICCRVCPDVACRLVHISSSSFEEELCNFAESAEGEGLTLIDGLAAAEFCPFLPRAASVYPGAAAAELGQGALPGKLMRQASGPKSDGPASRPVSLVSQPPCSTLPQRFPRRPVVPGRPHRRVWQHLPCRSPHMSVCRPVLHV